MAGNATIGALRVSLGLDSAQFTEGLKTAQTKLSGLAKVAAEAGAAVAIGLTAAATAIGFAVKGAIDAADELSKTAQKVGVGVEALSRLKYAADLSDVSLDGLATGLRKLGTNLDEVATGRGDKAATAFKRLGISVKDSAGNLKSSDAVMSEVAGRFGTVEDGATKTALAVALFGKSGADLLPLLNSGADGLKQMGDEAQRLGLVIDTKTAQSAEAFNDNLTRLHGVATGVTTQLMAGMAPALESVSNALVGAATNAASLAAVGQAMGGTLKVLATTFVALGAAVSEVGYAFFGTFGAALKLMQLDLAGAQKALVWAGQGMVKTFTGSTKMLGDIWAKAGTDVAAKAPGISDKIALPAVAAAKKIHAASDKAAKEAEAATRKLRQAAQGVVDSLLTDDEAYAKKYAQNMRTLQAARDADLISLAAYTEAVARLQAQAEGRGITAATFKMSVEFERTPETLAKAAQAMARARTEAERLADTFYDIANAVDGAFRSLKRGDWFGASQQIMRAAEQLKQAFASGTGADKFSAVAGLAQGVGGAIGGTFGNALGGAAGGAMAGFSVAGLPGAVVGGLIGGISSLFGSSKAKKAKKKAEAAQAAADEAARLQDLANQKRAIEIQLMRAQGDEQGALNTERSDALAAADPSLRNAMQQLYGLADAATAAAKAAAVAAEAHQLTIAALRASGDEAGAAALEQADYLAGLDASNRALAKGVIAAQAFADTQSQAADAVQTARTALSEARDREAEQLQATIDKFAALRDSLADFRASLDADRAPSTRNTAQLAAQFARTAARARLGDADAAGALADIGQQFIAGTKATARSQGEVTRTEAQVRAAVLAAEQTAGRQVDVASQQLASLNAQVDGLLQVNTSVLSVRDAIAQLGAAISAQTALVANRPALVLPGMDSVNAPSSTVAPLTAVAPAAVATGADAQAAAIVQALGPVMQQMVINTRTLAENSDEWTAVGLRTVAA